MPSNRRKLLRPYHPLHPLTCNQTEQDFKYMHNLLQIDRRSLARFQEIECNSTFKCPPLMAAYYKQHYECMKFLLKQGANPEGMNEERYTIMHLCIQHKDLTTVTLLLEHGFDLSCYRTRRDSYLSLSLGNEKITSLLLQHGAETDCLHNTEYGHAYYISNLSKALQNGHSACAKLLLVFGAITEFRNVPNIHQSAVHLNSFAHCVIRSSIPKKSVDTQKRMFEMLQQFGVDLYQRNEIGITVLEVLQFQSVGDEESNALANSLAQLLNQPMTLMSLTRIAIKKALGREIIKKLNILKELHVLPPFLLNYLHFPEV